MEFINAIYGAEENGSRIRRVNVNLAPLSVEDFRRLKERNIGTFQLFQETYHRPTYGRVHLAGPKKDLDWRASSFDRAMQAGIDDVGMGLLYGLYDWRFETLALMAHIAHLEERFGVGCHTISVPHRTGHRVGFGLPAAIHLERASLSPYCALPCRTRALSCPLGKNRLSGSGRWNSAFPRFRRAAVPIRVAIRNPASSRRHNFSLAITAPLRK